MTTQPFEEFAKIERLQQNITITEHAKNLSERLCAMAEENGVPLRELFTHKPVAYGNPGAERTGFHGVVLVDHSVVEAL